MENTATDLTGEASDALYLFISNNPTHWNWFIHCVQLNDVNVLMDYITVRQIRYTVLQAAELKDVYCMCAEFTVAANQLQNGSNNYVKIKDLKVSDRVMTILKRMRVRFPNREN